jgi:mannose-6-phosphate isomerase-like protein (cupin superfamily)
MRSGFARFRFHLVCAARADAAAAVGHTLNFKNQSIIMTPQITTLDPVTTPINMKTILAKDGFTCSLLTLAPGDETPRRDAIQIEEHVLFVIEGEATIRYGEVNTILAKDQALLIRQGEEHVITGHPGGWTKILRVDVPPRQIMTPQIITFDR